MVIFGKLLDQKVYLGRRVSRDAISEAIELFGWLVTVCGLSRNPCVLVLVEDFLLGVVRMGHGRTHG